MNDLTVVMLGWGLSQDEAAAVRELAVEALERGWAFQGRPDRGWRITAPPHDAAGALYDPPTEVCDGRLSAYDQSRTLAMTGIASHRDCVALARQFLGWQAELGGPKDGAATRAAGPPTRPVLPGPVPAGPRRASRPRAPLPICCPPRAASDLSTPDTDREESNV